MHSRAEILVGLELRGLRRADVAEKGKPLRFAPDHQVEIAVNVDIGKRWSAASPDVDSPELVVDELVAWLGGRTDVAIEIQLPG